jgi:hypothetical protein
VIVESPFAGDVELHRRYVAACIRDSLERGEAPFASHAIYAQVGVLDDDDAAQRARGIAAGFAWRDVANATAVYFDLGVSKGMTAGIRHSKRNNVPLEYRSLIPWRAQLDANDRRIVRIGDELWAELDLRIGDHVLVTIGDDTLPSRVDEEHVVRMSMWPSRVEAARHITVHRPDAAARAHMR